MCQKNHKKLADDSKSGGKSNPQNTLAASAKAQNLRVRCGPQYIDQSSLTCLSCLYSLGNFYASNFKQCMPLFEGSRPERDLCQRLV